MAVNYYRAHISIVFIITSNIEEKITDKFGCIYCHYYVVATVKSTNKVCDLLLKAVERRNTYLLIWRDFNYRKVDWENESLVERHNHLSS